MTNQNSKLIPVVLVQSLLLLTLYLQYPYGSTFNRSPVIKIPQQIIHLQHPSLVTVAMHSGSFPSLVHPIGMSAQPGSLKTAFYITAYNERGFISVLSKCQSGFNDLLSALTHSHADSVCECVWLFSTAGVFSNLTYLYSLPAINSHR